MRKLLMLALILGILQMPLAVYAAENVKEIAIELNDVPDTINLGDSVTLTAETQKHGSSFKDSWTNAQKISTEYDAESGLYLSTAEFKPTEAGNIEVSYAIEMKAGKNGTVFTGTMTKTIVVVSQKTIVGAEIRNQEQTPVKNGDVITGYRVTGEAFALWSDGSGTDLNQVVFVFFKPSETQKVIPVSFDAEGASYRFTVTVTRTP